MAPFGIKKHSKVLIRRLKIGNVPNTVCKCPYTATIGAVNVFKKQRSDSKVSQSPVADGKAPQLLQTKVRNFFEVPQSLQTDLQASHLSTSLASQDTPHLSTSLAS